MSQTLTYLDALEEVEESDVAVGDRASSTLYPDANPEGTRLMWERIRAQKAERRALIEAADSEDAAPRETTEPLSEIDPLKAPGDAGTIARRVAALGWEVRAASALEQVHPVLFKNDSEEGADNPHLAGDVRYPGYRLTWVSLLATRRNDQGRVALAFRATWTIREGKGQSFTDAETFDPILKREWRKTSTKPRPARDWEIEEGVEPPIGFRQWLDIVAPNSKPKTKTKKKQTEDAERKEPTP